MKRVLFLIFAAVILPVFCFGAGSELYPWPTSYSFGDLASWSQPLISSGTADPNVASASEGDLFLNTTDSALKRLESGAWVSYGSGGGGGSGDTATITAAIASNTTDIAAHTADQTDPHGATMTVSVQLNVGSGTADCYLYRIGTGTVGIASYTVVVPMAATPSAVIATGTLWYDSNTSKLRCYDGASWHDLW